MAIAQPISTNSKSPIKGEEKNSRPKIERTLIQTIKSNTSPPNKVKDVDIRNKARPILSLGRASEKCFSKPKLIFIFGD